jgi:hypothetical protein
MNRSMKVHLTYATLYVMHNDYEGSSVVEGVCQVVYLSCKVSLVGMKVAISIDHAKLSTDILILWLTYRWVGI